MLAAYREAWAAAGRAPADAEIQLKLTCYLDADRDTALRTAEELERNYVAKMAGVVAGWAGRHTDAYRGYEQLAEKVAATISPPPTATTRCSPGARPASSSSSRGSASVSARTLAELLPAAVPGLAASRSSTGTCLSSRTPDRLFLVGRRRRDPRVVVGRGCSGHRRGRSGHGHGFKHAPGVGEHLADLVLDRTPRVPLAFCDPDRFDADQPGRRGCSDQVAGGSGD